MLPGAVMSWPAVKCQGGLDCVNRILQVIRVESRACAVPRLPEKHHRPLPCHNGRWYDSGWCFIMHHKYTVAAEAKVPYYLRCRAPGSGFEAEIVCKMAPLLAEARSTRAVQRPAMVMFPHPKLWSQKCVQNDCSGWGCSLLSAVPLFRSLHSLNTHTHDNNTYRIAIHWRTAPSARVDAEVLLDL